MKNILILPALLMVISCRTSHPSVERYTRDSTIIREVPVLVEVPGSVIQSPSINIDSLVNLLRAGIRPEVINNTLIREDPETKLQVGLLIDELGNLSALCEQQDRMIQTLTDEVTHWKERYETITVVENIPWWKDLLNNIFYIALGSVLGWIVVAIIKIV